MKRQAVLWQFAIIACLWVAYVYTAQPCIVNACGLQVKRSGWQAPTDTGLWKRADELRQAVWDAMPEDKRGYLEVSVHSRECGTLCEA